MQRLQIESEKAKKVISVLTKSSIILESLERDIDLNYVLTRPHFEELCSKEFDDLILPIEQILLSSGIKKENIDDVILVGGSTKIPKIQTIIKSLFQGKKIHTSIDPSTCISLGASIFANSLNVKMKKNEKKIFDSLQNFFINWC